MSKRFTETEKWKDPWFCDLTEKEKLFWIYLVDNCDHAGIWKPNWPLVDFYIKGLKFDHTKYEGRIRYISEDKWFIQKFIDFQYNGKLNPENRTHKSVIDILEKEGAYKGLTSPMEGVKGTGTGTVLVKGSGLDKVKYKCFKEPTVEDIQQYCLERKNKVDAQYFIDRNSATGWVDKNGNKYKDWKAVVRIWESWNKATVAPSLPSKRPILIVVVELIAAGKTNYEIKADLVGKYIEKDIDEAIMRARGNVR